MNFWQTIHENLVHKEPLALLYVLESKGSSPGRQGFKMIVSTDGWMKGSIGGGFMEHKLVELAKSLLCKGSFLPFMRKQIHRSNESKDMSGMICSGEQLVSFYYLDTAFIQILNTMDFSSSATLDYGIQLTNRGITRIENTGTHQKFKLTIKSTKEWSITELPNFKPKIYIIGGGHVGLALSNLMHQLQFQVIVIDDRMHLNTFEENNYADVKKLLDYEKIDEFIKEDSEAYVAVMSFGYRTDRLVIKKLVNKKFKYFGVLGSTLKMKKLFTELQKEGFDAQALSEIHTPAGVPIHSKTPMEIAISISAEIIKVKNS